MLFSLFVTDHFHQTDLVLSIEQNLPQILFIFYTNTLYTHMVAIIKYVA